MNETILPVDFETAGMITDADRFDSRRALRTIGFLALMDRVTAARASTFRSWNRGSGAGARRRITTAWATCR